MHSVSLSSDPLPLYELCDTDARSVARVAPTRGGMATSFAVGEQAVFYLDEATLLDPAKNVRGGAPVLFPSPGKLAGDEWRREGRAGTMKQHGFARNLPWKVESTSTAGRATVTLSLESSDVTRAQFPWDFRAELAYSLSGATLEIGARIANTGRGPMPFGFGLHPYFAVADKARVTIPTKATRVFDNVTKRVVPFAGFDLSLPEVDAHLLDHGSSSAEMRVSPDGPRIAIRASAEFTHWVVWSVAGKDFVCLEPWTCPGDALNSGERLIHLEPGEARSLTVAVTATWGPARGTDNANRSAG
jgi:galactose mutarotase-like enzyme